MGDRQHAPQGIVGVRVAGAGAGDSAGSEAVGSELEIAVPVITIVVPVIAPGRILDGNPVQPAVAVKAGLRINWRRVSHFAPTLKIQFEALSCRGDRELFRLPWPILTSAYSCCAKARSPTQAEFGVSAQTKDAVRGSFVEC
jgi:hypothetical protein